MVKQSKPTSELNHCDASILAPVLEKLPEEALVNMQKWLKGCEAQADITTSGLGCDENWDCWQVCQHMQHALYQVTQKIKQKKEQTLFDFSKLNLAELEKKIRAGKNQDELQRHLSKAAEAMAKQADAQWPGYLSSAKFILSAKELDDLNKQWDSRGDDNSNT